MLCYHGNRSFTGFACGFSLYWPSCQISSVTHSLFCENAWKRGWESDRDRVSGRLCWPQAQRASIIWSAWVGEGCVPVSFQRETVWDRAECSDTPTNTHSSPYSAVKHIRQEREECRAVLVSSSTFYMCFTEHKHSTWVIRWLWRFFCFFPINFALFWYVLPVLCFCLSNHKMLIKTFFYFN